VEECGGLDKLEQLQQHEDQHVYERAVHILDKYFGAEDEGEVVEAVNGDHVAKAVHQRFEF